MRRITPQHRITREQAEQWEHLATLWKQASATLSEIEQCLMLEMGIVAGNPLDAIRKALDATNGQSYMFTPQSEWTGGDSMNPKNFKFRPPHIINGYALSVDEEHAQEYCEHTSEPLPDPS